MNEGVTILVVWRLAWLAAVLALAGFCWFRARGRGGWLVALAQITLGVMLVLGFAGIESFRTERTEIAATIVEIRDESESMEGVAFSNEPLSSGEVERIRFAGDAATADAGATLNRSRTDAALGLTLGAGVRDAALVLRTDGRETQGSLLTSASRLDRPLFLLAPRSDDVARLLPLELGSDRPTGSVTVQVRVEATKPNSAEIEASFDGAAQRQTVELKAGLNTLEFQTAANGRSSVKVEVAVRCQGESTTTNNRYAAIWTASRAARVVLAHQQPTAVEPLASELQRLGVDVVRATRDDLSAKRLEGADALLVFGEAAVLATEQQNVVEQFVRNGGGVAIVGGEKVYAPDAFQNTDWERWLPVTTTEERLSVARPSFAMVLIIDKSESMELNNRLQMAKQAAKQTVNLLDPADQVGLLAFGTESDWISEIAPSGDKKRLLKNIEDLKVEGETNLYPAMQRAQLALEQADADYKHLILLTDGISAPGDFGDVAKRLKERDVTVATVSIGSNAEQLMLRDIARLAGGRHIHCTSAAELPNVLVRETQQAVRAIEPTSFKVFPLEGGFDNVSFDDAPPLLGAVATAPKDDTKLAYLTDDGQPLIVWRKHEAGMAASIVCDAKSLLNKQWRDWPGFLAFWQALISKVERPQPPDPIQLSGTLHDGQLRLTAEVRDGDGKWDSAATVVAAFAGAEHPLRLVAPGQYQTKIPADAEQRADVDFSIRQGDQVTHRRWSGVANYGVEHQHLGVDAALLAAVANRKNTQLIQSPSEIRPDALPTRVETQRIRSPLWFWFAAAAAGLLVLETALRRWSLNFGAR